MVRTSTVIPAPFSVVPAKAGTQVLGFTLIELLVALTIIALLLSLVVPRYFGSLGRAEESVLKENLYAMRDALDKHYADTGRYPASLDELVAKKYLRSLPTDPMTQSPATWIVIAPADPQQGAVYDVKSGAKGAGRDGKPYEQW
jgi:general secretion pathway protein G